MRRPPYWLFRLCDRFVGLFGYWITCTVETVETGEEDGWITRKAMRPCWMIERRPA